MNHDKQWLLMTYYCPTHGDVGKAEPIQFPRKETLKNLFDKTKPDKNI